MFERHHALVERLQQPATLGHALLYRARLEHHRGDADAGLRAWVETVPPVRAASGARVAALVARTVVKPCSAATVWTSTKRTTSSR